MKHHLIPQFIIRQMAAGRSYGSFPAAGLFIDISGFSTITDTLMAHGQYGAEVLTGLIKNVFAPLVASIYAQQGFVATIYGDALLVFFIEEAGRPPAVHRALAAAWEGQVRCAATATAQETPYGTFHMSTKAGLATGNVDWAIVSAPDEKRFAYYFRGEVVDGSAAAEKKAGRGEVVLAPAAYAQVQELVAATAVDDHFLIQEIMGRLPPDRPAEFEPVDAQRTAPFFPQQLPAQPFEGEFRQVVSMFIGLPDMLGREQLTRFIRQLFNLQDRYGGYFNHVNFGDKGAHLLLIWGAPVAHENDIERALNFVLDLQMQSNITINAGISYSIAYAGFIGSTIRQDYTAYSRGVNLASRLMSAAPPGGVWVDEPIAGRVSRLFAFVAEGQKPFKGFSTPQTVFALEKRKEVEFDLPVQEMVGRDDEFTRLLTFVQPIFASQFAGLMIISGEAGIGKSHLAQHLQISDTMTASNVRWALCQTDEILRESLNPFIYWLRRYFGQTEKQSAAGNKQSFNRRLDRLIDQTSDERLANELDRLRSFLGALLGWQWTDSLYAQLDARSRYENTMQSLVALVQAESRQQPLVLFIEDVQWLDEDSWTLLSRLVRALETDQQNYPVAVIATARPDGEIRLADGVDYAEIKLVELSRGMLFALIQDQLGGPPAADLLNLLVDHAQGNPFFTVQMLYYLQERNLLAESKHGWRLVHAQETLLPPDVRALLVARLDTLERQVKEAVQTAAVLGREFDLTVLGRMLAGDEASNGATRLSLTLTGLVDRAEQAAVWTALTQIRYIFRHALLRDVAYAMQLQSRLQSLHALAATTLETLFTDEQNAPHAELGYHTEQAGMTAKARHYLRLAGDKATDAYQNSLAAQYYVRALHLTPAGDDASRFDLLKARAKVLYLSGEREAQRENITRLEECAARLGDQYLAEAKLELAQMEGVIGNFDAAITAVSDAVALAEAVDHAPVLAGGHLLWGWYLYRRSDFAGSRTHYEKVPAYAQVADLPVEEANSLNGLGILAMDEGDYARSLVLFEQGRERYRQAGHPAGEGNILNNLAVLASRENNFADAKRYSEEALALRRQIGDRKGEGNAANNLGEMCRALGHFTAAEHYYHLSLDIRREVGDRRGEALVLTSMAILATDFGEYARADQLHAQALVIIREIADLMLEGVVLMNQAVTAVDDGRLETGLRLSEQAVAILRQSDYRIYLGLALHRLGSALFHSGRMPDARAAYQEAAEIGEQMDSTLQARAEAGLADIALAAGHDAIAREHVENALHHLQGSPIVELEEPFPLALTFYRVLDRHQDPRATEILHAVYQLLQDRAAGIMDPDRRQAYLHQVPAHREIISAYAHHAPNV